MSLSDDSSRTTHLWFCEYTPTYRALDGIRAPSTECPPLFLQPHRFLPRFFQFVDNEFSGTESTEHISMSTSVLSDGFCCVS